MALYGIIILPWSVGPASQGCHIILSVSSPFGEAFVMLLLLFSCLPRDRGPGWQFSYRSIVYTPTVKGVRRKDYSVYVGQWMHMCATITPVEYLIIHLMRRKKCHP